MYGEGLPTYGVLSIQCRNLEPVREALLAARPWWSAVPAPSSRGDEDAAIKVRLLRERTELRRDARTMASPTP